MTTNIFYRFRSIDNLFGDHKELEQQSIFFAPPSLLNDPVEGFKDIYFQGDEILWRNFFNHYLLCLMKWCIDFQIIGDDFDLDEHFNPCINIDDLHKNFQEEFSVISERFIDSEHIKNLIRRIAIYRKKVSDNELKSYLRITHYFALYCIYERLAEISAVSCNSFKNIDFSILEKIDDMYFTSLEQLEAKYGEDKFLELQSRNTFFSDQTEVAVTALSAIPKFRRKLFTTAFISLYVSKLEQLMFPDWFAACFMSECTNSSVWGNYGKNHTGVCMVFSYEIDSFANSYISLDGAIHGWGREGSIKGKSPFRFYPIKYEHKYESINFFESIALLSQPSAYKNWFSWNGIISPLAPNYTDDWIKKHYDKFYKSVTKKTNDWAYENEHRLLICNMLGSYSLANKDTTLRYDFKSLKGIIFGIKTSDDDKTRIIEAIERKVKDNNHYDFKFYQAYYCRKSGEIKHYEMSSLRFKSP